MSVFSENITSNLLFDFSEEDKTFIRANIERNLLDFSLSSQLTERQKVLIQQISKRQKVKNKLPLFYQNENIYYPENLSLEQCSSEKTALFKSQLFSGEIMIDLCAGFGVDSYFISKNFKKSFLVERNQTLADIVSHNLFQLAKNKNICISKGINAEEFLEEYTQKADLIYIDPARRDGKGNKIFLLQQCEPNVPQLLPRMLQISNTILIKTSPLLDIKLTIDTLQFIKNVYILSVGNECKELLFEIEKDFALEPKIHAVDLDTNQTISFLPSEEKEFFATFALPKKYLYEPNVAILKSGAFNILTKIFDIKKIHSNTHLYTSEQLIINFPGRIFEINDVIKPSKKEIQQKIISKQANITIRNFPDTVASIRQKWNIKEGGEHYIFLCTLKDESKVAILCKKSN